MAGACELTAYQVQGLCERYLEDLSKEKGADNEFQVINYSFKRSSETTVGFLGQHQHLNVKIAAQNGSQIKNVRFFAKSAPTEIESIMEYLDCFGVFKKEVSLYHDVLPHIQKIFPGIAPQCYYAVNNLLVFEDLAIQGYKMASGRDGTLDYEHLNCALESLAALHAASVVFEKRQGRNMNEIFPEALKENAYPSNLPKEHLRIKNFSKAVDCIKEMIKTMPKYKGNLKIILEKLPKCMEVIYEKVKKSKIYKNVLLHGDLWSNNLMFQYGKDGATPIQCRLVDFQLARYGPPLLDVLAVLTIPTTRKFREEHLEALLANYYHFITELLKYEGLCMEDYMPKDKFLKTAEDFRLCGLIESCVFSHMTLLPSALTNELTGSATGFENFFDEKRVEICMKAFESDTTYRERLTDMIEDLVDRYIL